MSYPGSNKEEADTKLVWHALDATVSGATQIAIYSPDTDVLVLALRRYAELCKDTSFVIGSGQKRRTILLKPIVDALGPNRTSALPAFHVLGEAGHTGSFAGKAKLACWKVFHDASDEIITAMSTSWHNCKAN
jgi:hypothetical protein